MDYQRDTNNAKNYILHKKHHVIKKLIEIFTDVGDVVIRPSAGSGVTLLAQNKVGQKIIFWKFEVKNICK